MRWSSGIAICLALAVLSSPGQVQAQTLADAVGQLGNLTAITSTIGALGINIGPDFQGTLLAPSDAAVGAVPGDVLANTTLLSSIISYHVLPTISELPAAPAVVPTNLTGQNMTINVVNSTGGARQYFFLSAVNAPGQGNSSDCAPFNNGSATVCKIDNVLIPPPNTLLEYVRSNPDLQGLLNITDAFGLTEAVFNNDNAYTLFAPNNAAVQEFLATAPFSSDNQELLAQVVYTLSGHIIYNTTVPFALGKADNTTTYSFSTLVDQRLGRDAQILEVAPGNGTVTSIVEGVRTDPANVVLADQIAGKSYVTIIDKVLDTGAFGAPQPAASPVTTPIVPGGNTTTNGTVNGTVSSPAFNGTLEESSMEASGESSEGGLMPGESPAPGGGIIGTPSPDTGITPTPSPATGGVSPAPGTGPVVPGINGTTPSPAASPAPRSAPPSGASLATSMPLSALLGMVLLLLVVV